VGLLGKRKAKGKGEDDQRRLAWWYTPIIPAVWRQRQKDGKFKPNPGKVSKSLKNKIPNKRAEGIAQVSECLPGKHKTLGSLYACMQMS
jgi:hypothetical protein